MTENGSKISCCHSGKWPWAKWEIRVLGHFKLLIVHDSFLIGSISHQTWSDQQFPKRIKWQNQGERGVIFQSLKGRKAPWGWDDGFLMRYQGICVASFAMIVASLLCHLQIPRWSPLYKTINIKCLSLWYGHPESLTMVL